MKRAAFWWAPLFLLCATAAWAQPSEFDRFLTRFDYETRAEMLNALPARLGELPKDKIIVAACPHRDRSAIAMAYLRSKGYDARYLTDGLIGLAERLRGDEARDFLEDLR